MKMIVIAGAVLMALSAGVRPSHATEAAWCLVDRGGNELDCSFVSQRQCLETARGTAAHCYPNRRFVPGRRRGY